MIKKEILKIIQKDIDLYRRLASRENVKESVREHYTAKSVALMSVKYQIIGIKPFEEKQAVKGNIMIYTAEEFIEEIKKYAGTPTGSGKEFGIAQFAHDNVFGAIWSVLNESGELIEIQNYDEEGE